jgi:hypothetical protein
MKTLTIPLKREYFEQIKRGEKVEEYRIATPYWRTRLAGREYDQIVLTLGYPTRGDSSRRLLFPWRGARLTTITHPHFGPYPVQVFAIALSDQIGGA